MKKFFTLLTAAALTVASVSAQTLKPELKGAKVRTEQGAKHRTAKIHQNNNLHRITTGQASMNQEKPENLMGLRSNKLSKKAPAKSISKGGAALYGWVIYSDVLAYADQYGLYNASVAQTEQVLENPAVAAVASQGLDAEPGPGYVKDGKLITWGDITFWGFFQIGCYYEVIDLETGEVEDLKMYTGGTHRFTIAGVAYNPDDDCVYGDGSVDGVMGLIKAPADNLFDVTLVKPYGTTSEQHTGLCFNTADHKIYAIDMLGNLERMDTRGQVERLLDKTQLGCPDWYPYIGALGYDAYDNTLYWNAQTNMGSCMYLIDCSSLTSTKLFDYEDGDEFSILYAKDRVVSPDAPAAGEINSVSIQGAATSAVITFTLPTVTVEGEALPASIKYEVLVNGDLYLSGNGKPGEKISGNLAVLPAGLNVFQLVAYTGDHKGIAASVEKYVGYDTPLAPENVTLTRTQISWDAVTQGEHDGYIDAKAVTYQAYLNGEAVGNPVSGTSVKIDIPDSEEQLGYEASVVAIANKLESAPGKSNKVITGNPLEVPVTIAPTEAQGKVCQFAGTGSVQWEVGDPGLYRNTFFIQYDELYDLDAWVFLPAISLTSTSNFYEISMQARNFSDNYPAEYFDICIGKSASPEAMKVLEQDLNPTSTVQTFSALYLAPEAGTYYIGLHATSQKDMAGMCIWDVKVNTTDYTAASPAKVSRLQLEAAAEGKLEATATFTLPTKTMGGQNLPENQQISAVVRGAGSFVTVTGLPGEEKTATVLTEQSTYNNLSTVTVTTKAGELEGLSASSQVWTGVDLPGAPKLNDIVTSTDGLSVELKWDAPTEGENGGYFVPEDCTYWVVMYDDYYEEWYLVEKTDGFTGTASVPAGTAQDFVTFGVCAVNEVGNGPITYASDFLGEALKLPIFCDLAQADDYDPFPGLGTLALSGGGLWMLPYWNQVFEGADLGGLLLAGVGTENGDRSTLVLPHVSTRGTDEASFSIKLYNEENLLPNISLWVASCDDYELVKFGTIDTDFEGFSEQTFRFPAEFQGKNWVQVFIVCDYTDAENQMVLIREMSLSTKAPNVSAVKELNDAQKLIIGGKGEIKFKGLEGLNVVVNRIDGARVAEGKLNGSSISVEKGIYVVKAGDKTAKVIVK